MKVHFIRHAQAMERLAGLPDEQRSLTCRGRKRFRKVSASLKKMAIDPDLILASPKIRAVQTAEILSETIHFHGEILISPDLADGPDLGIIEKILQEWSNAGEIVIIGHEPGLGRVIAELLRLDTPCHLPKGGVVSLKIFLRETGLFADLTGLITGGGKRFGKGSGAMAQLMKSGRG